MSAVKFSMDKTQNDGWFPSYGVTIQIFFSLTDMLLSKSNYCGKILIYLVMSPAIKR